MYRIERTAYGVKLTFGGFIEKPEMAKWVEESEKVAGGLPAKFGVLVDMRELKPLPADAQGEMQKGQRLYKSKGMERSAVILNSPTVTLQFKRLAKETGIAAWERYIDASATPNWEAAGREWLVSAADPGL